MYSNLRMNKHYPIEKMPAPLVLDSRVDLQDTGVENLCLARQAKFCLSDPVEAISEYSILVVFLREDIHLYQCMIGF